jgi:hypothetical protein
VRREKECGNQEHNEKPTQCVGRHAAFVLIHICPLQSPFVRSATLKDLRPEQQRVAACDPPLLPLEDGNTNLPSHALSRSPDPGTAVRDRLRMTPCRGGAEIPQRKIAVCRHFVGVEFLLCSRDCVWRGP